jgi:hypothetical protein
MAELETPRPQFCPWCGSPIGYESHEHRPRHETLRDQAVARGDDPGELPERVRAVLEGEAFVAVCPGCRRISHVVSHAATD